MTNLTCFVNSSEMNKMNNMNANGHKIQDTIAKTCKSFTCFLL